MTTVELFLFLKFVYQSLTIPSNLLEVRHNILWVLLKLFGELGDELGLRQYRRHTHYRTFTIE
jgi:hypothetical protein